MKIRVVIVDDHEIVLKGLRLVLEAEPEVEIAGEATNAQTALECIAKTSPDQVLLDMELPDGNGIQLLHRILECSPKTRVIFFSAHLTAQYVREAVEAGASGYLGKIHKTGEIATALKTAGRAKCIYVLRRPPRWRVNTGEERPGPVIG